MSDYRVAGNLAGNDGNEGNQDISTQVRVNNGLELPVTGTGTGLPDYRYFSTGLITISIKYSHEIKGTIQQKGQVALPSGHTGSTQTRLLLVPTTPRDCT